MIDGITRKGQEITPIWRELLSTLPPLLAAPLQPAGLPAEELVTTATVAVAQRMFKNSSCDSVAVTTLGLAAVTPILDTELSDHGVIIGRLVVVTAVKYLAKIGAWPEWRADKVTDANLQLLAKEWAVSA